MSQPPRPPSVPPRRRMLDNPPIVEQLERGRAARAAAIAIAACAITIGVARALKGSLGTLR